MVKSKYTTGWAFRDLSEVVEYYERTGMIAPSFWAFTKSEFIREIRKFESIVNNCRGELLERNREYLHRLYTIKFELGI